MRNKRKSFRLVCLLMYFLRTISYDAFFSIGHYTQTIWARSNVKMSLNSLIYDAKYRYKVKMSWGASFAFKSGPKVTGQNRPTQNMPKSTTFCTERQEKIKHIGCNSIFRQFALSTVYSAIWLEYPQGPLKRENKGLKPLKQRPRPSVAFLRAVR